MNSYVEYKSLITNLQSLLGLSCINFWDTTYIHPYVIAVLRYLEEQLVLSDSGDIYANMKTLCETIDDCNEILLEGGDMADLYFKMGLTDLVDETEDWSDVLFAVTWGNVATDLWESIKCNYASVLWDLEHQECACHCGCTEGTEIDESDNLYSKLVGNGSSITTGCGCGK